MATAQVWEYFASGNNRNQVAKLPGGVPKNITISSTHAESSSLDNAAIGFRLISDTAGWFKLYKSGAASPLGDVVTAANGIRVVADLPECFDIPLGATGYTVSFITA